MQLIIVTNGRLLRLYYSLMTPKMELFASILPDLPSVTLFSARKKTQRQVTDGLLQFNYSQKGLPDESIMPTGSTRTRVLMPASQGKTMQAGSSLGATLAGEYNAPLSPLPNRYYMPNTGRQLEIRLLLIVLLGLLQACSSVSRDPLPEALHEDVTLLGRSDLRYWGDEAVPFEGRLEEHKALVAKGVASFSGISHQEHHYLAVSGGGANGAYVAVLLVGWTAAGTRPRFAMVTGISTGALIAPFAFLGPEYDDILQKVYTTTDTAGIVNVRSLLSIVGSDAIGDTSPLAKTIEQYLTDDLIEAIGAEYRTGRTLLIGTTNLDAGRPVMWNIGRIANTGHPDAPDLIRNILRASASIPGAFSPVYIPVQAADGRTYDEMHVDGGTSSQLFLYPAQLDWDDVIERLDVVGRPKAYLIRNARITPDFAETEPRMGAILGRTIDSLIRTQGTGDIYRIYAIAQRDDITVELSWITEEAGEDTSQQAFDPVYMSALFEFGYQRAVNGEAWMDIDTLFDGVK
jgi:predicted acylesterase/phospholipase RssA